MFYFKYHAMNRITLILPILLLFSSLVNGQTDVSGCTIEYGGHSQSYRSEYGSVYGHGGNITFLSNCIISNSNNSGIRNGSNSIIELSNTQIIACRWPISYLSAAGTIFDRNTVALTGNTFNG